jgi:hypothetical protein
MHAMQYGLCEEPPNYGCDGVSWIEKQNWNIEQSVILYINLGRNGE